MASLKKPSMCITEDCVGIEFEKEKKPERWICALCKEIVASRPVRNAKDKCYECGSNRDEVEFRKGKNICKPCYSAQQKRWRTDNKGHLDTYYKKYYTNLDKKERWRRVKRSIERGPEPFLADRMYHIKTTSNTPEHPQNPSCPIKREYDLDRRYLKDLWDEQDGKCAITNITMAHVFGRLDSASIDRINSSKGHVKGNIQLVCLGINRLKHIHSNKEVSDFLNRIYRYAVL